MDGECCSLCPVLCRPVATPQDSCIHRPRPKHYEFQMRFSEWKAVILGSASSLWVLALWVCLRLCSKYGNAQPLDTSQILTFDFSYHTPDVFTPSFKFLKNLYHMLNSHLFLVSGEVGAKRKRGYGNILPPFMLPYRNWADLGTWSLSSSPIFLSWGKANVCLSFEKTSMSTPFTPILDGRSSAFNPGCVVNAADVPSPWKLQIKVIFETYFDYSQVF